MLGSPLYMSPEQMTSSRDVDARTDIWSLGVTLFYLVTGGKTPFAASTVPEICSKVLTMAPQRADFINPEVPAPLAEVIEQCLQKDPERRFSDMSKLARALEPFGSEDARGSSARIARVIKASVPPPRSVRESRPDLVRESRPELLRESRPELEPPNAADSTTTRGVTTPAAMPPMPVPPRKDRSALAYAAAGSGLTLAVLGVALGVIAMGSRADRESAARPAEPSSRPAEVASIMTPITAPSAPDSPPASATPAASAAPTTMTSAATKPKPARTPARTGDPGPGPGSYR